MHLMLWLFKVSFSLAVLLFEGLCWSLTGLLQVVRLAGEVRGARRRLMGGLHCENRHAFSAFGTFECTLCQFRWTGSGWVCPNPACEATTPFLACPVCRASVRNPYIYEGGNVREAR